MLDVKDNDPNFRNPLHLFHKSVVIGSSKSSDMALVQSFLSRYGDESEKNEVQQAFHRCMYRVRDIGEITILFCKSNFVYTPMECLLHFMFFGFIAVPRKKGLY